MANLQASHPELVTAPAAIGAVVREAHKRGETIGLVPTMGALHAGHLSLVETSALQCDLTIVTLFVNASQFTEGKDWERYPRDLQGDMEKLAGTGAAIVFAPAAEEIYPQSHATTIDIGFLERILEGRCRPGHFSGVATILVKLFHLIPADTAFFGHKDYQQLKVIEQVVRDLNIPIKVYGCPTVRDKDGLALSSRNTFLSQEQRQQALSVRKSLQLAETLIGQGETDARVIVSRMREQILASGDLHIDYVVLADADTLEPVSSVKGPTVALVAVRVGNTRLIDNQTMVS